MKPKPPFRVVRRCWIAIFVCVALLGLPLQVLASVEEAVFAGGCFWCLEHDLEGLAGVISVESGYTGGDLPRPTYRQVSSETTGHQEAVRVRFDSAQISYAELLSSYWRNVDPLDADGQFCDQGDSYRAVIFTRDAQQNSEARESANAAALELAQPNRKLRVQIKPLSEFWLAEDYHQNYAELNGLKYSFYRFTCGRDRRLDQLWGERARTGQPWEQPDRSNIRKK